MIHAPSLATVLGIELPIIQAPMAGVSTAQLAAAVSNAGGLGSIAIGAGNAAQGRAMIEQTRALTGRPFNVNAFCHAPARREAAREAAWLRYLAPLFAECAAVPPNELREIYTSFNADEEAQQMLLQQRPHVVSFHFGLPPANYLRALREAGIRTLATATRASEAAAIEAAGVDAIVAQGVEAGGHRGLFDPDLPDPGADTLSLVRELVRQCRLPVIAAGGIMDGADIHAMQRHGAAGVQLGTAFVLCPESAASAAYRAHLQSTDAHATRMTSALTGRPARGLPNRLMAFGEAPGHPPVPDYPITYDATKRLNAAAAVRDIHDFAVHWAGTGAPRARAMPAAQLMQQLAEELRRAALAGADSADAD